MANPTFTEQPILLIDKEGEEFTLSWWAPPTGIWRRIGPVDRYSDITQAQQVATHLAVVAQAAIIISFPAVSSPPKQDGPQGA